MSYIKMSKYVKCQISKRLWTKFGKKLAFENLKFAKLCVCVCGEDILEYLGYISKVFAIDSSMVKLMLKLDFII